MNVANILAISGDFWSAFLNVLGIVGLILVALFIVVFISDWILSTIDGREGIFFKKNKNQVNNTTTNITNNYGDNYIKPEEQKEEVVAQNQENIQQDVDFEKARQEEEELARAKAFEPEENEEPVSVQPEEPDYDAMINEINDSALNAYNKVKNEEFAKMVLSADNEVSQAKSQVVEEVEEDEEDNYLTTFEEENFDDEEIDEEVEEDIEEFAEEEQPKQVVQTVDTEAQNEILRRLEEQVNILQQQLEDQRRENEELKRIAEEEKARLNALIAKRSGDDDDDEGRRMKDYVGNLDELEARLEVLKERLKSNEKELRINKKEYIPLARVKKTLESDKKKLRRREAIVAKRKVLLYGVNNYADIDEEKAKELNEELDLLEGLRLSVAHCEEVMEANKDRYPILEHTNKILTENNAQIKADIAQVEEEIAQAKQQQSQDNE